MAAHTVSRVLSGVVKTVDDWIMLPKHLLIRSGISLANMHVSSPTFGGPGHLSGHVKVGSTLVSRPVRLYEAKTGVLIREQSSDAAGAFMFTGLRLDLRYNVSSHDIDGGYNDVIAANVTAML